MHRAQPETIQCPGRKPWGKNEEVSADDISPSFLLVIVAPHSLASLTFFTSDEFFRLKSQKKWVFQQAVNDWLEDKRRFGGCDPHFAAYTGLLSTIAVFRRSRFRRGFRLLGWRTALALGAFNHLAWSRFLSGLPWNALPYASKQDRNRTAESRHSCCGSSSSVSSSRSQRACRPFG